MILSTLRSYGLLILICCGLVTPIATAQVPEQDSLALVALYDSTDGTNWTDNTNWLSGPVSTWFGITVSGDSVTKVNLGKNNLVGTIPIEIGNLANVTELGLYSNQLNGSIPAEICNLANLTYLSLAGNSLSGTIPKEFGNMTNLEILFIDSNQLLGSIPPEIGNMENMAQLNFSFNQLSGSIPKEIGNMTNLMYLELQFNQLSDAIPAEICNLKNLINLGLQFNQLSGSVPSEMVNLTYLTYLWINDNQFTELPNLSSSTALKELRVQNNKLTFEDIEPNVYIDDFTYTPQDSVGEKKDTTVTEGESIIFSVTVGGSANQYQWFKNDVEISGADSSAYVVEAVTFSDSGSYTCQITNTIATELTLYSRPTDVQVTSLVGVTDQTQGIPTTFALLQNYPNPFNPETRIRYHLPQPSHIKLVIYDVKGQLVQKLVQGEKSAGYHEIFWNGRNSSGQKVAAGIYIYRIEIKSRGTEEQGFVGMKKMVLMK